MADRLQFITAKEFSEKVAKQETCYHPVRTALCYADRYHLEIFECEVCLLVFEDVHCCEPVCDYQLGGQQ